MKGLYALIFLWLGCAVAVAFTPTKLGRPRVRLAADQELGRATDDLTRNKKTTKYMLSKLTLDDITTVTDPLWPTLDTLDRELEPPAKQNVAQQNRSSRMEIYARPDDMNTIIDPMWPKLSLNLGKPIQSQQSPRQVRLRPDDMTTVQDPLWPRLTVIV